MSDTRVLYAVKRHALSNGCGWGKYHLIRGDEDRIAICGVKFRRWQCLRYSKPIEEALADLEDNGALYRTSRSCKNCVRRAQKLRNPLDRMAGV